MAITAAVTLSSASGTTPITFMATVTVTNGNATTSNVRGVRLWLEPSGLTSQSVAAECGMIPLGPGTTTAVAGSNGTLALSAPIRIFAPFSGELLANPASQVYTVGADVQTDASGGDSLVAATTTNYTASAPTSH